MALTPVIPPNTDPARILARIDTQNAATVTHKVNAINVDLNYAGQTGSNNLTSGQLRLSMIVLPAGKRFDGAGIMLAVAGDYTANNNNKIGLYTLGASGIITLRASTANDGNLFKATANTMVWRAFTAPYTNTNQTDTIAYVGYVWSASATVAAPQPYLKNLTARDNVGTGKFGLDYTGKSADSLTVNSQTDLPATVDINSAGTFLGSNAPVACLYGS